ncbi:MAG: PorT family protein, partial [Prevotella sp.]|nr:PorT family protein [Prevotella sp.]
RITIALLFVWFPLAAINAQAYKQSKYYNDQSGRLEYGYNSFPSRYYGFRVGVDFAHISAKDEVHDCDMRARLNLGAVVGYGLTSHAPLYIETGLSYAAKGGRKKVYGARTDYNLAYIQLPLVLKYIYSSDAGIGIQPFMGGYFACGVGGSIKDYETQTSYKSFSRRDAAYSRWDAGLRFGVGASYSVAYLELSYELGLANISHDQFLQAHNRNFLLLFGVNF